MHKPTKDEIIAKLCTKVGAEVQVVDREDLSDPGLVRFAGEVGRLVVWDPGEGDEPVKAKVEFMISRFRAEKVWVNASDLMEIWDMECEEQ